MLTPERLRLLQTVARTQSYSAAARELGFTQPAISYQMRSLERDVGTPLTVRVGTAMRLTSAGHSLLEHADKILSAVRAAERDLTVLVGSNAGTVKIGAFPSSCATVVPAAMATLRRELPAVRLVARMLVGWPDRQVEVELWPDQLRVPAVAAMLEALKKVAPAAA